MLVHPEQSPTTCQQTYPSLDRDFISDSECDSYHYLSISYVTRHTVEMETSLVFNISRRVTTKDTQKKRQQL